LLFLSDLNET